MNKQHFKDDKITLYTRNNHLMPELLGQSVDAVICDPPYGVSYVSHTRTATPLFPSMKDDDNLLWVAEFLSETYRVLKDPGAAIFFTRWDVLPEWLRFVEEAKLSVKQLWYWDKGEGAGGIGDLDGKEYEVIEMMIFATKGRYRMRSKRRSNVFRYTRTLAKDRFHPIQKPEALLQEVIHSICDGYEDPIIVDPYAGSGSTLMAAKMLGYRAVGYELSPDDKQQYADKMAQKFQQSVMMI